IQEEACILGVPCITLRENTERPESVEVGANVLVGRNKELALNAARQWLTSEPHSWANPFGDGDVACRILDIAVGAASRATSAEPASRSISVIGMGYMGLPIACLLAEAGHGVAGVDLDKRKVDAINRGDCPFDEPGLPDLLERALKQQALSANTAVASSDVYLIAVPTPHKAQSSDLSFVFSAADAIAAVARDGQLVIIESTIPPKTCRRLQEFFKGRGLALDVVHCPERALPGSTLDELVGNDRIIGAATREAASRAQEIYGSFVTGQIFVTDQVTAECVKLVENTFRDVNIAFANELADICDELEVDVFEVIDLANRHPRVNVLKPGPGVGGHCIPIDPWFLVENTRSGDLVRQARKVNDQRPRTIANKVIGLAKEKQGNRVGVLGVAYKANVDDCRETPAAALVSHLESAGLEVRYHDPFVESWNCERSPSVADLDSWADVLVLVTDHDEYAGLAVASPLINTRA
ncbi:MAG: nucleotide sugar dehydrogenase, partial [Gammaproteobacteria bacterium]|nr:nucleotide sugar dehydrogenase [Gammaproteobacteria bacterium]